MKSLHVKHKSGFHPKKNPAMNQNHPNSKEVRIQRVRYRKWGTHSWKKIIARNNLERGCWIRTETAAQEEACAALGFPITQKTFNHTRKCVLHNKQRSIVLICVLRGHERPTTTNTEGCTCSPTAVPAWSCRTQSIYFHSFDTWKAMKRMQHKDRFEKQ